MFEKVDIEGAKVDIESSKANIEKVEAEIEKQKADIRNRLISDAISEKTIQYVLKLFSKYGKEEYFGRTMVEEITGLLLVSIKTSFVT